MSPFGLLLPLFIALSASSSLANVLNKRESGLANVETAHKKMKLNEEFTRKFGGLREGCFPRPGGKGCRCTVKDESGHDRLKLVDREEECLEGKAPPHPRTRRDYRPSQNVRDPVRERAQQNYAAVLDELKNKFAGLKEGCYPRPKGCLCVIGKDATGREITDRRFKDTECKCQKGERGPGCPARGA